MKLSNSDMRKLMRQMGLGSQEIIDAQEVVIRSHGKEITITSPQVIKLTIQGETLYQVVGGVEKVSTQQSQNKPDSALTIAVNEEDVRFVSAQANVSPEVARATLIETGGDIAKAIMKLRGN